VKFRIDDPELDRAWGRLVEPERLTERRAHTLETSISLGFTWWQRALILFGARVAVDMCTPVTFVDRLGLRLGAPVSRYELALSHNTPT
jgi:hypothetical protein